MANSVKIGVNKYIHPSICMEQLVVSWNTFEPDSPGHNKKVGTGGNMKLSLTEIAHPIDLRQLKDNKHQLPPPRIGNSSRKAKKYLRRKQWQELIFYFQLASHWKRQVNSSGRLIFPEGKVVTFLWPDIFLIPRNTKTIIVFEHSTNSDNFHLVKSRNMKTWSMRPLRFIRTRSSLESVALALQLQ